MFLAQPSGHLSHHPSTFAACRRRLLRSRPTPVPRLAWSAPLPTSGLATMSSAVHTRTASKGQQHSHGPPPAANIKPAHHNAPMRHVVPQPADYDTSHTLEARKYLKTYGLVPPGVESFAAQERRCMAILKSRKTDIEKYQYLSVLRNTNVHLFYRLLASNIKVGILKFAAPQPPSVAVGRRKAEALANRVRVYRT